MAAALYAGLDVGGSSMKAGVVDDDGRVLASANLPTEAERGQEFGLARMEKCAQASDPLTETLAAVQLFCGHPEGADDRTLVVMERTK